MSNSKSEAMLAMQKNIHHLDINGLSGRMLKIAPSKKNKKREILLIYGHHSSIERMYGIAEAFADYGTLTMPDLPGFGGMDSFHKIGMEPTLDNFVDYLASFIKLKYRNKKFTLVGMSLGFVIITRMLQRYPDISKKVELLISIVGFSHKHDFIISKKLLFPYLLMAKLFKKKIPSVLYYNLVLHPSLIRLVYAKTPNARKKFLTLTKEEYRRAMDFEVHLWRTEDIRTYWSTAEIMVSINNCDYQVDLPLHHISTDKDQYFDSQIVEQHMRVIFNDFKAHTITIDNHSPSIIADKSEAAPFIPDSIRKILK